MAANIKYEPGYKRSVVVTHPATPSSGDPVRYGPLTALALTAEGEGGNPATMTTVDFGPFTASFPVLDEVGGDIAVGEPVFYDDALGALNNDAVNGYFFGIALQGVGTGATATIDVLHTPSPGAGAYAALGVTTAKLANGAVTEAKLNPSDLTGLVAKVVADKNLIGGIGVLHRIDIADASGNTDLTLAHKTRVIDAWGINTGIAAHATADTWQVKNGADAISDAVAKTAGVNAVKRISSIDPAHAEIAAGGTLRLTAVKDTNAAVTVYVLGIRVS
jgi:hypothetical protein